MKEVSIVTVNDVVGYNDKGEALKGQEPLFMDMFEGYPSMEDVFELEEVIAIVESKNKGAELMVNVDYLEYVDGVDDPDETVDEKSALLAKFFDDLDYYIDNDLLVFADAEEVIIEVEDPAPNEIVETDMLS